MKCAFCDAETIEKTRLRNLVVVAHHWCIEDRKAELNTRSLIECLLYEDGIKEYRHYDRAGPQ